MELVRNQSYKVRIFVRTTTENPVISVVNRLPAVVDT